MKKEKPVVQYVGEATIYDWPSVYEHESIYVARIPLVLNHPILGKAYDIKSSKIIKHPDKTGRFETRNTIYEKVERDNIMEMNEYVKELEAQKAIIMEMNEYVKELEAQVDPAFVEKIKDWPVETKLYMYLHNIQLAMMKEFKENQVVYPKASTKDFGQWKMPEIKYLGFPTPGTAIHEQK